MRGTRVNVEEVRGAIRRVYTGEWIDKDIVQRDIYTGRGYRSKCASVAADRTMLRMAVKTMARASMDVVDGYVSRLVTTIFSQSDGRAAAMIGTNGERCAAPAPARAPSSHCEIHPTATRGIQASSYIESRRGAFIARAASRVVVRGGGLDVDGPYRVLAIVTTVLPSELCRS